MSLTQVVLSFNPSLDPKGSNGDRKEIRDALSAIVYVDKYLFLASDETTTIERLETTDGGKTFKNHKQFQLLEFVELPGEDTEEIDIEGLDYDSNYLWIVGSHSLKRKEPKPQKTPADNIKRLLDVSSDLNRYFLGRIPTDKDCNLTRDSPSAKLEDSANGNQLIEALGQDKHFQDFLKIPSKDNGIDFEGLAVSGSKVLIGLRGPVLRGWATILELEVLDSGTKLELKKIGASDLPYRKHFLQLGGLGVRDLVVDDRDLLILAGPTMDLDGPVELFRWKDAMGKTTETLTWQDQKELFHLQLKIPYGQKEDHAEGITFLSSAPNGLLVVYDSPSHKRKKLGTNTVQADLFSL
jgi:Protein of unknown function (DUF3616)